MGFVVSREDSSEAGRTAVWLMVVLVAACGTAISEPAATEAAVSTTQRVPTSTTGSSSTTAVPTVMSSSTVPLAMTTETVLAGEGGVVILPEGAADSPVTLWSEPSTVAFAVGEDLVIAQRADPTTVESLIYPYWPSGPLVVFEPSGVRKLGPPEGFDSIALHDAGVVEGRPVALASIRRGVGPYDTEERLIPWAPPPMRSPTWGGRVDGRAGSVRRA